MLGGERRFALGELLCEFVAPHPKPFQLAFDSRQGGGQGGMRGAPRLHLHRQLPRLLLCARGRRARIAQPVAHAVALLLERRPLGLESSQLVDGDLHQAARGAQFRVRAFDLENDVAEFGVELFGMRDSRRGIVHVISPELGTTQPGMIIVCGDSHTSTHGAFGALAFGNPTRITAQVRMGRGEVVDIEREVALGGPLHSKGVLILAGFLGGRFGNTRPLSLNASLVFEQSYGGIDGDSASAAELFALLSALADAPIRQSFAVTGSVDQHGQIQAIGGVNEKIEGFFDACQLSGLADGQGVIIPASNVKHLMLRRDVVAAAAEGRFAIQPIDTVDQGMELLTGIPAGAAGAGGAYPVGSLNYRIAARLDAFAARTAELWRGVAPGASLR